MKAVLSWMKQHEHWWHIQNVRQQHSNIIFSTIILYAYTFFSDDDAIYILFSVNFSICAYTHFYFYIFLFYFFCFLFLFFCFSLLIFFPYSFSYRHFRVSTISLLFISCFLLLSSSFFFLLCVCALCVLCTQWQRGVLVWTFTSTVEISLMVWVGRSTKNGKYTVESPKRYHYNRKGFQFLIFIFWQSLCKILQIFLWILCVSFSYFVLLVF